MSIWAKTWAYEQHPKRVEDGAVTEKKHPAAKAVLVALAEYPGVGQRECWPSQKTVADMTDMTDRQVRRCLTDLEAQGLISRVQRRRKDGTRRSDRVTLLGPIEAFGPPQDADEEQPDESSGSQADERAHQPDDSSGHEPSTEPSEEKSGVQQAEAPRIDLVKVLVDDLDTLDVYLSDDEKSKYAGQIGQLRRKEVSDKRIIRGLKRLVADWDRYPHTSVQKALSFAEGNTHNEDKPTQALAGSPPELVESLRNVAELKRYAPLAERFDFSRLEKDQQPDWTIFSQLGGDDSERYRNLQRIVSRARQANAKATCSA